MNAIQRLIQNFLRVGWKSHVVAARLFFVVEQRRSRNLDDSIVKNFWPGDDYDYNFIN